MRPDDVVVVGVGMMTPVGLTALETAAAVRAGTARFTPIPFYDAAFQPFTVAEVPEDGLPPLLPQLAQRPFTSRVARMLRLATAPLVECAAARPADQLRLPLALALPETETNIPLNAAEFLAALALQTDGCIDPARSDASARGRAGGVGVIGRAVDAIRAGAMPFALAGGIDSYRDLYVLSTLDRDLRVKSNRTMDGFIPGEAAAFVLLTTREKATSARLPILAALTGAGLAMEPGHLYSNEPYRGDGLANAVGALLARGAPPGPVQEVFSSMNGENHWAKEWGVAFLRNRGAFNPDHGMHHPADCYGDAGAAAGALMVGLATLGIAGGYRRSPALVYGSNDAGPRAALLVHA